MRSWQYSFMIGLAIASLAGLCFGQGEDSAGQKNKPVSVGTPRLTREALRQAVEKAKDMNPRQVMALADSIDKEKDIQTRSDLLPDFEALLTDKRPEAQFLGAQGLFALKNPQSTQALSGFLKGKEKNLRAINEPRPASGTDVVVSYWEIRASVLAVKTLGEMGDRSVIPLLESLQGVGAISLERGGWPVEEALVKLGSLKSLTRLKDGDDPAKITQAAVAMYRIKDANAVPDLIAVVKDPNVAEDIRVGALNAVGVIKAPGVPEFLVKTMDDHGMPKRMRRVATAVLARSGDSSAEAQLRRYAENRSSDIRADAFIGMMTLQPTAYLDQWFRIIVDVNEVPEFRLAVAGMNSGIPRQLLKERKKELYSCLSAAYSDGRPFDKIRGNIWMLINQLFGEEPTIVLSTRSGEVASQMRDPIGVRIKRQNLYGRPDEVRKEIDKAVNELIRVE